MQVIYDNILPIIIILLYITIIIIIVIVIIIISLLIIIIICYIIIIQRNAGSRGGFDGGLIKFIITIMIVQRRSREAAHGVSKRYRELRIDGRQNSCLNTAEIRVPCINIC